MVFQEILISVFVLLLGLCIGSFLNVVIYRLNENKSFLKGRSFCPSCKHKLIWKDLFPVFSYLYLVGKCRYCKTKISWQYPIVELATGIIFFLIFNFSAQGGSASGWQFLNLAFLFYVASVLIIIFIYDLKHYLIPDNVLFPAIAIAFVYKVFVNLSLSHWDLIENWKLKIENSASIVNLLLAIAISSGFFFVIWLVSGGKWMGFGDVKLAVLLGLILGFPNILVGLFLSFFFGAIIGIILIILEKKKSKSEIPFGPFLIFGTFLTMFWGEKIIAWYLNLVLF
jgi:prepilin signal peptidase PulO-like enzyme (type II secretory pathway)